MTNFLFWHIKFLILFYLFLFILNKNEVHKSVYNINPLYEFRNVRPFFFLLLLLGATDAHRFFRYKLNRKWKIIDIHIILAVRIAIMMWKALHSHSAITYAVAMHSSNMHRILWAFRSHSLQIPIRLNSNTKALHYEFHMSV